MSAPNSAASPRTRRSSATRTDQDQIHRAVSAAAARTAVSSPCRAPMVPACITTQRPSPANQLTGRRAGRRRMEDPLVGPVQHQLGPGPGRRRAATTRSRIDGAATAIRAAVPVDPGHRAAHPRRPATLARLVDAVRGPDVLHVQHRRHPAEQPEHPGGGERRRRQLKDVEHVHVAEVPARGQRRAAGEREVAGHPGTGGPGAPGVARHPSNGQPFAVRLVVPTLPPAGIDVPAGIVRKAGEHPDLVPPRGQFLGEAARDERRLGRKVVGQDADPHRSAPVRRGSTSTGAAPRPAGARPAYDADNPSPRGLRRRRTALAVRSARVRTDERGTDG